MIYQLWIWFTCALGETPTRRPTDRGGGAKQTVLGACMTLPRDG